MPDTSARLSGALKRQVPPGRSPGRWGVRAVSQAWRAWVSSDCPSHFTPLAKALLRPKVSLFGDPLGRPFLCRGHRNRRASWGWSGRWAARGAKAKRARRRFMLIAQSCEEGVDASGRGGGGKAVADPKGLVGQLPDSHRWC